MKINKQRIQNRIDRINEMSIDKTGGYTRLAFSEKDIEARAIVKEMMKEAGMAVRVDEAGNILGSLKMEGDEIGVVAVGSHIDTVRNGGKFDGLLGCIAGIEIANCITENQCVIDRPFEVIVFADEEGARFNSGLIGSKSIAGQQMDRPLNEYVDENGVSIAAAMESCGLHPEQVLAAKAADNKYHSFVELHIEQGIVLEKERKQIGIVNGIKGPYWMSCTFEGEPNHAGGTPMNMRKDALTSAANFAAKVEEIASDLGDMFVATIGVFRVFPGGINTIPGKVELTIDIRDLDMERRKLGIERILQAAEEVSKKFGVKFKHECLKNISSRAMSPCIIDTIEKVCLAGNYDYMILPSGPFHDTLSMASICNAGMIFVPSINGVSHSPNEDTNWEDVFAGAQVLLDTILDLTKK